MFVSVIVLLCLGATCANPNPLSRKGHNSINQHSFNTVLLSIEDRLRSLDNAIYSSTPISAVRMEQNSRKLDAIESRFARFEASINSQFDKISENMSNRFFKDDLDRDHTLRKVDSVYQRINNQIIYLEMRIEMGEKRILDKFEIMLNRLGKMEETLTNRESDIEVEVGEVLAVVDEIKSNCKALDLSNITSAINKTLMVAQNEIKEENRMLADSFAESSEKFETALIKTQTKLFENEKALKDGFEEYSGKMLNIYDVTEKNNDEINKKLRSIASSVNQTRIDQQNSFRSLIVQVGRLGGKTTNVLNDGTDSDVKYLGEKIDANLENIVSLQNLFLESCHRVQMDEAQMETKISDVLEKLLDAFDRKSDSDYQDLQDLAQSLKAHDTIMKRSMYTNSQNLGVLLKKGNENKEDLKTDLNLVRNKLEKLTNDLENIKTTGTHEVSNIQNNFAKLDYSFRKITESIEALGFNETKTRELIAKIQSSFNQVSSNGLWQIAVSENGFKTLTHALNNVTSTLKLTESEMNNILKNIQNTLDIILKNNTSLDDSILDIFGTPTDNCSFFQIDPFTGVKTCKDENQTNTLNCLNFTIDPVTGNKLCESIEDIIRPIKRKCLDYDIDVRLNNPDLDCCEEGEDCSTDELNPQEDCLEFDIDIRNGGKKICRNNTKFEKFKDCEDYETDPNTGVKTCKDNNQENGLDCLDYTIDPVTGKKKCQTIEDILRPIKRKCLDYSIDVRFNNPDLDCCEEGEDCSTEEDCLDFVIDENSGKKICRNSTEKAELRAPENCTEYEINPATGVKTCKDQNQDNGLDCLDFIIDPVTGKKKCQTIEDLLRPPTPKRNCSEYSIDVRFSNPDDCLNDEENQQEDCLEFDIDVRSGGKKICRRKREQAEPEDCEDYEINPITGVKICKENNVENCLDFTIDPVTGKKKCESREDLLEAPKKKCSDYSIDVRLNNPDLDCCEDDEDCSTGEENQEDCLEFDIDATGGKKICRNKTEEVELGKTEECGEYEINPITGVKTCRDGNQGDGVNCLNFTIDPVTGAKKCKTLSDILRSHEISSGRK